MASNTPSPPGPPREPTPAQLARTLERIVAEETGCEASWAQHPHPVTMGELCRISLLVWKVLWDIRGQL